MVLEKGISKEKIDIVLWDFDYNETHFYSIMAYPTATQTDYNSIGIVRGERVCLEIDFPTLEEAKKAFNELKEGKKNIIDFKSNFTNKEIINFI